MRRRVTNRRMITKTARTKRTGAMKRKKMRRTKMVTHTTGRMALMMEERKPSVH